MVGDGIEAGMVVIDTRSCEVRIGKTHGRTSRVISPVPAHI